MPFFEVVSKDISHLVLSVANFFKSNFANRSLLVYPHYPSRGSTIYKVANKLGYNVTNKVKPGVKHAIYWEYLTHREEYELLEELQDEVPVINLHNRDISKKYVDQVHQEVFGYSTRIDPLTHQGKCVKKSDINAKHDGQILSAPITTVEENCIYQLLIDNTHSADLVVDIRVPVIDHVLDFVYIKYRAISERFKNTTTNTIVKRTDEVFTREEIDLLNTYCKRMKLEYGELDVLRNKDDGRIYTVDVNNTPQGPPSNTSKTDTAFVLKEMSTALEKYMSTNKV